ncbi:MAG: hypothetical protein JRN52_10870 [Nitrososphaerota archaeon]|nr:hypothetical protein [Nitrososphaerota archaeon]
MGTRRERVDQSKNAHLINVQVCAIAIVSDYMRGMIDMSQPIPISVSPFVREIIRQYQLDGGIVGEETNIGTTFFILTTKDMRREQRLHEAVINLSGAGKTTLVENVLKPFREHRKEDVIDVVRFTGAALERYKGGMDGKILLLSQSVGNEPTSVRPLLSEGKLGLMVVEKPEGSSKMETTILEAEGMPVFVTTSTDPNVDPELLRRVVQRTVDESPQQTARIKKLQAMQASTFKLPSLTKFRLISDTLRRLDEARPKNIDQVLVPYADEIQVKLPDDLDIRSKLPQFLKLIEAIALVKSVCYRGLYEVEISTPIKQTSRVVIATLEDFYDALYLAGVSFFRLIPATASAILDFLSHQVGVNSISNEEEYKKCTIREIQRELKLPKSTIYKYADYLADRGFINKDKEKNENNVEVSLYSCNPLKITDAQFELASFNFRQWFDDAFKGLKVRYAKVDSPIELPILASVEGISYACVNVSKMTLSRTVEGISYQNQKEKDSSFKEKVDQQTNGYCKACDTDYGHAFNEHIRLAHGGKDPNAAS